MQLEHYLKHIGYTGPFTPSLEVLTTLQQAHLEAIPYENLDIHLGKLLTLDPTAAYDKLIAGRGGWCYEMNTVFAWALWEIGFQVQYLASGVLRPAGVTPVGDHLILLVTLPEGQYLADVGFGDGPIWPLPLIEGQHQAGFLHYAIEKQSEQWVMRNHQYSNTAGFVFDLTPKRLFEFAERCQWLQSAPESGFVRTNVCQRLTNSTLYTLRGAVLTTLTTTGETRQTLADAAAFIEALAECFGLQLPEAEQLWPKIEQRHQHWLQQTAQNA
jgi:N-hydroxyarylamine O-acetyltransferase